MYKEVLILFTVYVPSNSGLSYVREQGLQQIKKRFSRLELKVIEQRGEEIPITLTSKKESSQPVIGITGEDLLENFLWEKFPYKSGHYSIDENRGYRSAIKSEIYFAKMGLYNSGSFERTIFGLPTLCILGEEGLSTKTFVETYPISSERKNTPDEKARKMEQTPNFNGKCVAIPNRYEALIKSRIFLEDAEVIGLDGQVDVTAAKGDADYAIDIVCSGKTIREFGLGIFPDIVFMSDGVILANKGAQEKSYDMASGLIDRFNH